MAQKLATGVWGIDLGQCALKALHVEMVNGEMTATAFDYIEYPKILSQPDADPDELTREALNKFLSRNTLRGDNVVISVPGQSGLARFVKLPPVEEKKIGDIVKFEAKQQIPFPLEEVVWDYQKLGSGMVTDGFALDTEIGLFAMKRDMVNRYLQHFKDVRVEVHYVQMAPLALCNFVAHDLLNKGAGESESSGGEDEDTSEDEESSGKKKCIVALDIGTDNSNLVITDGERIIWQRPIPIGGNHFTRALTKDLKLTFAKAEHLKRNAMKSPDLKKILGSLRPVLNDFVQEVQRSLGYFTNTHRDAHIKYMIGLGNAFRLPGLQKFLQEKLQIDVRKLQKIKRMEGAEVTAAPQFTENILSFAVAEGLALQGLKMSRIQTNLLPSEIQFERMVRAKKPWAVAAAAILLAGAAFLGIARAVEHSAQADKAIEKFVKAGNGLIAESERFDKDYNDKKTQTKQTEDTVLRVAAGVNERFNWNLFYKYLNDMFPTADGKNIVKQTRIRGLAYDIYFKNDKDGFGGPKALALKQKRLLDLSKERTPTSQDAKDDETIKRDLVAVNFEGVAQMYVDDFKPFAEHLKDKCNFTSNLLKQNGMPEKDADWLLSKEAAEKLKDPGWLIEIRGYTYHKDGERFVIKTLVENLANPNGVYPNLFPPKRSHEMSEEEKKAAADPKRKHYNDPLHTHVNDRLRYVFMYRTFTDSDPQGDEFKLIRDSFLKTALGMGGPDGEKGPGKRGGGREQKEGEPTETKKVATRDGWSVVGRVAAEALGVSSSVGGGQATGGKMRVGATERPAFNAQKAFGKGPTEGGNNPNPQETLTRTPRTEFVIFFVWLEPLTPDGTPSANVNEQKQ